MSIIKSLSDILPALKIKDSLNILTTCDVLLMCHDVDRGDLKDGLPYSKLIDSVQEDLVNRGYKCKQFALPSSVLVGDKAWSKPYSANRYYFMVCVFFYILRRINVITKMRFVSGRPEEKYLYRRVLKKAKPKIIIAIGAPSALCQQASNNNIPVLELLHAIGYDCVRWGWDFERSENLPSHILSLDRISTKAFSPLLQKGLKIIEIPHPWHKRFIKGKEGSDMDPNWIKVPAFIPKNKKVILISLTCSYDGDHGEYPYYANILENGLVPNELVTAIEQTKNSVFWCLRRHPIQIRNSNYNHQQFFLDELVARNTNCEWQETSKTNLISLLRIIDGHMSMSSSTAYDAAMIGVKSLLFCPTLDPGKVNANWFLDLVAEGYAIKTKPNVSFIIKWVNNIEKDAPISISDATENDWVLLLKDLLKNNGLKSELN